MPARPARIASLVALALGVPGLAACGEKEAIVHQADTEGIYVDVGELDYQVQISRQLNPHIVPDDSYVAGIADFVAPPGEDETYFGVFIRVQNETDEPHESAASMKIVDTQGNEYRPLPVDPQENPFVYQPQVVGPGELLPQRDSAGATDSAQGALLLFRVRYESLGNRPVELEIADGEATARVDLDL